jgi:hypothetical protein
MDGPGFESQQGQEIVPFSETSRPVVGPTQPPIKRVLGLYAGGKGPGC